MADTNVLEFAAATLSELQSSLETHVQQAVDLVNEAVEVEQLRLVKVAADVEPGELTPSPLTGMVDIRVLKSRHREVHESIVARTQKLLEKTRQLQWSVQLERELLGEIRQQLDELKGTRGDGSRQ